MKKRGRSCGCHSHNGLLLSPEGLAQRGGDRRRELLGVDDDVFSRYLDKVGSVSALIEIEDDFEYVPDHHELFEGDPHGSSSS